MKNNNIKRILAAVLSTAAVVVMTGISAFAAPIIAETKQIYINCTNGELDLESIKNKINELVQSYGSDYGWSVPTNPAPVNPAPVNPAPTNPAPVNPAPSNPAPTNPAPTNPAPVNPAPTNPAPTNPAPDTNSSVLAIEREVVTLVNQIRAEYGLSALTLNEKLSGVARAKAVDMASNNYFSHTSPTYGSPFDMMTKFGISYRTAGENIAMGYSTAKSVVDGWMNSPGHRANILNTSFTQIGVGYTSNGHYWAQMFIG